MDQKSKTAFEILVRENTRMLSAYLYSIVGDASAVDDLFQETMLVAWRRLDECDLSQPFGPWLRGIASRLVMAHYRKKKIEPVLLQEGVLTLLDQQFESISSQPGDIWDDKVALLRQCLAALPEKYRAAVLARYEEELSVQQCAQQLEVSVEACKKRLQRARARLADCLRRNGLTGSEEARP